MEYIISVDSDFTNFQLTGVASTPALSFSQNFFLQEYHVCVVSDGSREEFLSQLANVSLFKQGTVAFAPQGILLTWKTVPC